MLESIMKLGEMICADVQDPLSARIKAFDPVMTKKQKKIQKRMVIFDFNTVENKLSIDMEEMSENSAEKYLNVGSVPGPRSAQWFVTHSAPTYILTELFPNLIQMAEKKIIKLDAATVLTFGKIRNVFFIDNNLVLKTKLDKKYRYSLDLSFLKGFTKSHNEILVKNKQSKEGQKNEAKELPKTMQKELVSYLKTSKYAMSRDEVGLYTVRIDGKLLVDFPDYRAAIAKELTHDSTEDDCSLAECNLCGVQNTATGDMSRIQIKYFTTNQVIFASFFDKKAGYRSCMSLCTLCMKRINAGERFILDNLKAGLGDFTLFIIPHIVIGREAMGSDILFNISEKILRTFNSSKTIDSISGFREEIEGLYGDEAYDDVYYLLDFVFIKEAQAATKVLKLIKDVRPSVFDKVADGICNIQDLATKHFGEKYRFQSGIEELYHLMPLRLKEGKSAEFRELLSMYEGVFLGRNIPKGKLISKLVKTIRVCKTGQVESFRIAQEYTSTVKLHWLIMRAVWLIEFLKNIGCIERGEGMDLEKLTLDEEIKEYIFDMQYTEQETAMFLLGCLLGKVGNAQHSYNGEGTYKPVLNKLNYNGLDQQKILRLVNEVFNKLRHEKILQYNEKLYQQMRLLLDANLKDWKLKKDEALFYLLAGYGYMTTKTWAKGKKELTGIKEELINDEDQ